MSDLVLILTLSVILLHNTAHTRPGGTRGLFFGRHVPREFKETKKTFTKSKLSHAMIVSARELANFLVASCVH